MMKAGVISLFATTAFTMNADGLFSKQLKEQQWAAELDFVKELRTTFPSTSNLPVSCNDITGQAIIQGTAFPCKNIDFLGFVSTDDMLINEQTTFVSDIWGWEDGRGRDVAIMCVNNGVWFVDATDPLNPKILGSMAAFSETGSKWCDVKVYKDVAYVIKDSSNPDNGIQVFDLRRLNDLPGVTPGFTEGYEVFEADFVYDNHGDSHNLEIDTDSGFLYSVGADDGLNGGTGCDGGLHVISLRKPLEPEFVTCIARDGYTHDAQCVVYDGPDDRFTGRQICFAFNEDTLTIWDVTRKRRPKMIARQAYDGSAYCHQGWITQDMNYLLLDDELDEYYGEDKRTKTFLVNIQDLRNPVFETKIIHETNSIDHNLYFWGAIHEKGWAGSKNRRISKILPQYAYMSNNAAGLRVVELNEPLYVPKLAGYFDVSPEYAEAGFYGSWSNFLFTSGTLAVTSRERGLFLLKPRMAFEEVDNAEPMETEAIVNLFNSEVENGENIDNEGPGTAVIVLGIFLGVALLAIPAAYVAAAKRTEAKYGANDVEEPMLSGKGKLPESSKGLAQFELS